MKKLIYLFLLVFSMTSYAQNRQLDSLESTQRIIFLESQLELIQSRIAESRVDSLYGELNKLLTTRNSQKNESATLKKQIEDLQNKLGEREKSYVQLQNEFLNLSQQIKATQKSISNAVESQVIDKLSKLEEATKETEEKLTIINVANYKSYVLAWYDLGSQLAAITLTAEAILLFPEDGEKVNKWLEVGKYAGILGGIVGVGISQNDQNAGIATSGLSLSLTALISTIFKDKQNQELIENVSRNVAFTDEVSSFSKIAVTFRSRSTELFNSVNPNLADNDWRPELQNVTDFYSLISVRRDLTVVIRQMKAKAEYLLTLSVTPKGEKRLRELISGYDLALESWEASEVVYLSTYNYLYNLLTEPN